MYTNNNNTPSQIQNFNIISCHLFSLNLIHLSAIQVPKAVVQNIKYNPRAYSRILFKHKTRNALDQNIPSLITVCATAKINNHKGNLHLRKVFNLKFLFHNIYDIGRNAATNTHIMSFQLAREANILL